MAVKVKKGLPLLLDSGNLHSCDTVTDDDQK